MRYLPFALAALLLSGPALAADAPAPAVAPAGAEADRPALPPAATPADQPGATPDASAATEPAAPPSWVYMVVRVKLTDTDITQVAFLRHPAITTLEACEQERAAGMMQGWRYYNRYYFKTLKGISYKIDFRCVDGRQYLSPWRAGDASNRYYLVRTTDATLKAEPQDSFFACRRALRKVTAEEGIDAFCGVASQAITEPPAEPAEAAPDAAPGTPGATPATIPGNLPATPAPAAAPAPAPGAGALPWSSAPAR